MKTDSAAFWDRVARRYAKMSMRNADDYEKTLDMIRAYLRPDDRVLELGCGTGTTALKLSNAVGSYIATDYSPEMIAIAAEKRAEAGINNLDVRIGRIGDGSLPQDPFNAILCFNLLHLLPNRQLAFREVAQTLRPGGLFISKTPCLSGAYRLLWPILAAFQMMGKAPEFHFLSPVRLEQEIRRAGFEVIETGDYPKRPPRRFIVARKR